MGVQNPRKGRTRSNFSKSVPTDTTKRVEVTPQRLQLALQFRSLSSNRRTEYPGVSDLYMTVQSFDYGVIILEACNAEMDGVCN